MIALREGVLSQKEKADRYDSLTIAIRFKIKFLEKTIKVNREDLKKQENMDLAYAYKRGAIDAYTGLVNDLKLWV